MTAAWLRHPIGIPVDGAERGVVVDGERIIGGA
jgi:hypothetical protein